MLSIYDLSRISGFTKPQIEQLISRHGVVPTSASLQKGVARSFVREDGIRYLILSQLREWSVAWEIVRKVDNDCLVGDAFNGGEFEFSSWLDHYDKKHTEIFLVIHRSYRGPDGIAVELGGKEVRDFRGDFTFGDIFLDWMRSDRNEGAAFVLNFSQLVRKVDDAISSRQ